MTSKTGSINPLDQWPSPDEYRKSMRTEFLIFVGAIMVALMLTLGYAITNKFAETVTGLVVKELIVQARSASGMAVNHMISSESPDRLMLGDVCSKLASDNPDIYWVGIAGSDNQFISHTDISMVVASKSLVTIQASDQPLDVLRPNERCIMVSDTIFLIIPISEGDVTLGTLAISSSNRSVREARNSSILIVGLITLGLMLVGIPGTLLMVRHKLRPITQITQALRETDLDKLSFPIPFTSRNEFGFLADTLRTMGRKLSSANEELLEKTRMENELQIARQIQSSILPTGYPSTDQYAFSGLYRSAKEVGGDYYDFVELDDNLIGFLVADVSGKSLPAMLVMLLTRDVVRKVTASFKHPARVLSEINRELEASMTEDSFVSMFFALLHKRTGDITCASAGHTSLLHYTDNTGSVERIKSKGFPLGLEKGEAFASRLECVDLTLSAGDSIIMYTDGITEAINARGEQFGLQRLEDALLINGRLGSDQIIKRIISQHQAFVGSTPQSDDITLLTLKWNGVDTVRQHEAVKEYHVRER
jgi:serine phosphatase RsbU (regulator of sigma subunit)